MAGPPQGNKENKLRCRSQFQQAIIRPGQGGSVMVTGLDWLHSGHRQQMHSQSKRGSLRSALLQTCSGWGAGVMCRPSG